MMRLFLIVILSLVVVSVVQAQAVVVEISNTMTDGKWAEERALAWELEVDAEGLAVEYTDATVPDHNCLSTTDLQVWYIDIGTIWYKYTFSASVENLKKQYAIRVSVDGSLSDWVSKYLGKPRNPRSG